MSIHGVGKIKNSGFTIVELLVVIVVIGILAGITIVSYTGVTQKASTVTLQSDLSTAKTQIDLYKVLHGTYPTTLDVNNCPTAPVSDINYCLKPSQGNTFSNYTSDGSSFGLEATNNNGTAYHIISNNSPKVGALTLAVIDPANWIQIGTQVWGRYNLNVGTRIAGATAQTNNAIVEKYCYDNTDAGCINTDSNGIPYGALYQWDEAMQYSTTPGAQGICPTGSHIPTDDEWKTFEMFLGMTQVQADTVYDWRGTNQGVQLKSGGSSGLNVPLAGYRSTGGSFGGLSSGAYLWSSSESGGYAWVRYLDSGYDTVFRNVGVKAYGYSVRCIGS